MRFETNKEYHDRMLNQEKQDKPFESVNANQNTENHTVCEYCKGKGKMPTDIFADTGAVWQPCQMCKKNERKLFYQATENEKINWFTI